MTDKMIRRFKLEGSFDDGRYQQSKETAMKELLTIMKDDGYIPVLDLDYTWKTWMTELERFEFKLVIQGVHVGEDAWGYLGVTNGKPVPSSRKSK